VEPWAHCYWHWPTTLVEKPEFVEVQLVVLGRVLLEVELVVEHVALVALELEQELALVVLPAEP